MIPKLLMFMLLLVTVACSDNRHDDYVTHEAEIEFSSTDIARVEELMKSIAVDWELDYYEKDREAIAALNDGEPSFFINLDFRGNQILTLTNVLVSHRVRLAVTDFGKMPTSELERLFFEVKQKLEAEFNIEFVPLPNDPKDSTPAN